MSADEFWKPFETVIADFDGLLDVIKKVMKKADTEKIQFAWRGQVDATWSLHSSLYRRMNLTTGKILGEDEIAEKEKDILVQLRRWGLHSSSQNGRLSILNQLAMLQHYGAPTRLIDITFNALVGAWFAVEEKWDNGKQLYKDTDARLFAFDVTDRLINENKSYCDWEDDFSIPWGPGSKDKASQNEWRKGWTTSVFAWKPANLDARIAAQNGGFLLGGVTASSKPDGTPLQFPKQTSITKDSNETHWWTIDEVRKACCIAARPHVFDPQRGQGAGPGAMYTFRIKAAAKADIRERLDKIFGYRHSTIYPDFSGFSSFATPEIKSY